MFSEKNILEFQTRGYTIFRSALPDTLLGDLRRASERGVKLARERHGPQIQVVQPIGAYPDMDPQPFCDYAELPALNEAVRSLLTPEHWYGNPDRFGLLIEPGERPWCTPWHRDLEDHLPPGVFESEYRDEWDPRVQEYGVWFAQINCPLYYDSCTWYVPESVYRRNNTEVEKDLVAFSEDSLEQKPGESAIAAERRLLRYCRAMPDAVQVHLAPGDFFIYRHCGLHLGNYSPDVKRVTIHDNAMNQEVHDFWRTSNRREEQRGRNAESYAASP